jgi:TRAP transporter TAXI family solute receptor
MADPRMLVLFRYCIALALAGACAASGAAVDYKIVTASDKGTYYKIGQDLAKFVAPGTGINLEVLATAGSAANIRHLRRDPGVKLAIVQADVYQAFLDRAASGNPEAAEMIRPLRVVMPLYNTEIHYIVRADSPLSYIHDIKNARINGGLVGSGAALITHTVYRMMFKQPIPQANDSYLSNEDALVKLITDKSVDVVVVAAGQPAPLIAHMKPEAQKYIKLLKLDPDNPASKAPLTVYSHSVVYARSYPNLLKDSFTTISVGAYLVTYNYQQSGTAEHLAKLAQALCREFPALRERGHPKWREVNLGLPRLGPGWVYYAPTARELRQCAVKTSAPAAASASGRACSAEERILGLCE